LFEEAGRLPPHANFWSKRAGEMADFARLLDEKLKGEWSTLGEGDLSAPLLDFVRDEGPALDTKVRAHVLLSLVYAKATVLNELKPSIAALLHSCSEDSEEWVRVIADLVSQWLPDDFKTGDALLQASVQAVANKLQAVSHKLTELGALPDDFCPLQWPFLSNEFMGRLENRRGASSSASPAASTAPSHAAEPPAKKLRKAVALPEKLQAMLNEAPLLSDADRKRIEAFFSDPGKGGEVSYHLLSERHVTRDDGSEGTEQTMIKLDPALRKWAPAKKFIVKKKA